MHRRRSFPRRLARTLAILACHAIVAVPFAATADGPIDALVQSVSTDSLNASVQHLQDFGTRQCDLPEAKLAAQWIAARFRSFGADSVFVQSVSRGLASNVIAIRRGTTRPNEVVLVGGHFDSISRQGIGAPGADDNASGTAAVLECARILCAARFERTLQFAAFSAEEIGLFGSTAYASNLYNRGDDLVGMINVDMIGYRAGNDQRDLDIISDVGSGWLRDAAFQAATLHVPNLPLVDGALPNGSSSDHVSFWGLGYSAIAFFEDSQSSSPYIHTSNDTYGTSYNDAVLATLSTRVAVALMATLGEPVTTPVLVQDFALRDVGGGIELSWRIRPTALTQVTGVQVQRASNVNGPYRDQSSNLAPATRMSWLDRDVPSQPQWYRLSLGMAEGARTIVGPLAVRFETPRTRVELAREIDGGDAVEIRWTLARGSGPVRLALYDVAGRRVQLLQSGGIAPGTYLQRWNRRDASGARVVRGVYWVALETDALRTSRKLTLLRP